VLAAALLAGLAAAIGYESYHVISGQGRQGPARAASGPGPARHPTRSASLSPSPTSASPAAAARRLLPVRAVAFGPGGIGQGDNPQLASLAIDRNPATAWHSNWYATAHFGNLQSGTGLLLDLGRQVTISSALVRLGQGSGAAVQLRAGDSPVLADLRPVASAADASGLTLLRPAAPIDARFVLIWFTRLPADPAGTFQASVYDIRLEGRT
jgi:hypothetical protein